MAAPADAASDSNESPQWLFKTGAMRQPDMALTQVAMQSALRIYEDGSRCLSQNQASGPLKVAG